MSRLISRAENWETVYQAFQDINFSAFDYNAVKQSLIDYLRLYFPESFNDFIETSEFIAVIETFAYIAELMAYRYDLDAHENFITLAQRKESVLRLAKMLSYTSSRNLPARGFVKVTSVSTTENVFDSNGTNLANVRVAWNDQTNTNWKEQFILVMNRILAQEFGTVTPTDRTQLNDVVFELYAMNNIPSNTGVYSYTASINGKTYPMEAVPSAFDDLGPVERRPANDQAFVIMYASDGLGDGSETTGFLMVTKQGTLQRYRATFDGVTPNQTYDLRVSNINEIDVWVNNVDPTTGATLNDSVFSGGSPRPTVKSGEWVAVDLANAQNIIFNTNTNRHKYEIETLDSDQIRFIFGDGEFADIPSGSFDFWARVSANDSSYIPVTAVTNVPITMTYLDDLQRTQTLTMTISLTSSLQNAATSEDIEHIRQYAPSVYYTQDRMVNGRDYNVFPLQDPSILKLRSVNRTFAGDTRYIAWNDPTTTYEDVKIFGDDLLLYYMNQEASVETPTVTSAELVSSYIQPAIGSMDLFVRLIQEGVPQVEIRKSFSTDEETLIETLLNTPGTSVIYFYFDRANGYQWVPSTTAPAALGYPPSLIYSYDGGVTNYSTSPSSANGGLILSTSGLPEALIVVERLNPLEDKWSVTRLATEIIAESPTTEFWSENQGARTIDYDTDLSSYDLINILKANPDDTRAKLMTQNWGFNVLDQVLISSGLPDAGLPDINKLQVIPLDTNGDHVPDNMDLADIINPKIEFTAAATGYELPVYYISGYGDVNIISGVGTATEYTPVDVPQTLIDVAPATYTIVSFSVANSYVTVSGDHTADFIDGQEFVVTGSTNGDGRYRIVSATLNGGNTDIEVAQTVPAGADGANTGTVTSVVVVQVNEYVYFMRQALDQPWVPQATTYENINSYLLDNASSLGFWKRERGRDGLNFEWLHLTRQFQLVDPAATNIIDMFVLTVGYYNALTDWLAGRATQPTAPTPLDLRTSYSYLLDNKMISDTVILHSGNIKILFGGNADPTLRARFEVVRSPNATITDNQVKTTIVNTVRNFFDLNYWEYGETFYFTELASAIHADLVGEISSVVLVPTYASNQFGDMFQVFAREDELFLPDITVSDIEIVESYTPTNLRLNG